MKKSSLGRRSSAAAPPRTIYSEFETTRREKVSGIPVRSRASSADRNVSMSSTLVRSKSTSNIRLEVSHDRRLTGGVERPSRAGAISYGSSARCSSYGGTKSKRDNRPLQDKEWQITALRQVEDVIRSIPEGTELFKTSIKPLTIKLFVDIVNLLLSRLDRSINITTANYKSEIPYLAKLMLYRGKIDKSWLISVNTIHAFPHALGFLHFLASCYLCQTQVDPMSLMYPENFSSSSECNWNFKVILPYLSESSDLYFSDHPDYERKQLELDKHILDLHFKDKDHLNSQIKSMETDIVKLLEANHREKAVSENLEKDVNYLEAELDKMMCEYEKKVEQNNAIKDEIRKIENDIINSEKKQETLNNCMKDKEKVIKDLQKAKEAQLVSFIDIKKIREKCDSLQRDIDAEGKHIQQFENQFFQEDLAIMALQKELEANIKKYTQMLEEFVDEISLENVKIPENIQDLNVEYIKEACRALAELKGKHNMDTKDSTVQNNKNIIEKLIAENAKLESELDSFEEKHNLLKEEINIQLMEHKKKMVELYKDLADIEDKLLQIAKNMPDNYEDLARRQTIIADEMEAELQEFGKRANFILSERVAMFEEYKKNINIMTNAMLQSLKGQKFPWSARH
uniref:Kinetochore protein NDC80 n=1 Tax=Triatoma infestans TaxID=30076 RepID=A0A023EXU7_TRIIF